MSARGSSVVSDEETVDELRAAWAEVSRGYARCWAAMAEVARRSPGGWESAEIAVALTFTTRRADYELGCAQVLVDQLPWVHAALAADELDHHKARCSPTTSATPQLASPSGSANGWCHWRRAGPPGSWPRDCSGRSRPSIPNIPAAATSAPCVRAVHGYLDQTGTAVLTGSGLPAPEAAAAAARLEMLGEDLRAAGYPATLGQTRADLFLRLLDGTLDGLSRAQILTTMLHLGPVTPADDAQHHQGEHDHEHPERDAPGQPERTPRAAQTQGPDRPERPSPAQGVEQPGYTPHLRAGCPGVIGASRPRRYGIEVRVRLSTLLGLDEHPAELPGWGPIPAAAARDLVAAQHTAEWRVAIVDTEGYLLHGEVKRYSYTSV
ncbi:MAG: hypothetical protein ACRDSH_06870 [Pseudonocardiaceae bacterium]